MYVTVEAGLPEFDIWKPVRAGGTLSAKRADTDLGDAAYTMTPTDLRPYDY